MKALLNLCGLFAIILIASGCNPDAKTEIIDQSRNNLEKFRIIFDTDINNEVDDQHALAYLLFNGDYFRVEGVTVNATSSYIDGVSHSKIQEDYDEAMRVLRLCGRRDTVIPLFQGAQGSFMDIKDDLDNPNFDGHEAVNFIIEESMKKDDKQLVLLPLGKLTNIALALKKEPAIASKVRIVWLGSNYPDPGEHNLVWDIEAMNYILNTEVPFELVTVGYKKPSGTAEVRVTKAQILHRMPGKGPNIDTVVIGRHGGEFYNWGDYSAELFKRYGMWGTPPSRSLFDQAAVAIVKNPQWAERRIIPAPIYEDSIWIERPENSRKITVWEWFHIYAIVNDFFETMDNYELATQP